MRRKTYEVFGCVDDAEIFVDSTEHIHIAVITANNVLGPARYKSALIYEVLKENRDIVSRNVIQRLDFK